MSFHRSRWCQNPPEVFPGQKPDPSGRRDVSFRARSSSSLATSPDSLREYVGFGHLDLEALLRWSVRCDRSGVTRCNRPILSWALLLRYPPVFPPVLVAPQASLSSVGHLAVSGLDFYGVASFRPSRGLALGW